ncbi:MAG: cell division protein ZapA [Bryobacterales bacterium]|jgi:cell division protein ZapA|nr:cell division protein ZapA [Bryobacterales bacterium]
MSDAAKRPVRITILGQSYSLLAQGDPREVERLAQSVDTMLHDLSRKMPNADTAKLAVLGCLHLADKLRDLETTLQSLKDRIGQKSEQLNVLLDQVFDERA